MLNEILDGVTRRVNELFGDDYEIYTDEVQQGLKEPCFFVQILEPSEKQIIGQRYYRQTTVSIQYFSGKVEGALREMNRAGDILLNGMEYITLKDGSLLRGTGRMVRPDMEQKALTFLVNYNMFVLKEKMREDAMGGLEAKTQLRRQED